MGFFERALNFNNGGKGFFIGDKVSNIIICILALIAVLYQYYTHMPSYDRLCFFTNRSPMLT